VTHRTYSQVPITHLWRSQDLRDGPYLSLAGHPQALCVAREGSEVAGVGGVMLATVGKGELPVAGLRMIDHLFFKDLREHGSDAFTDARLHLSLYSSVKLSLGKVFILAQPTNYQTLSKKSHCGLGSRHRRVKHSRVSERRRLRDSIAPFFS
jgi:hypothetical protein